MKVKMCKWCPNEICFGKENCKVIKIKIYKKVKSDESKKG